MDEYRQEFFINDSYVDFNNICRISDLFNFVQIITAEHIERMPVYDKLLKQRSDYGFVLTNVWGRILRPLNYGDILTVVSRQRFSKRAIIYRDYNFYVGGLYIGKAVTSLLIIDLTTRRLLKTTLFTKSFNISENDSKDENITFTPLYLKGLRFLEKYIVRHSDLDKNGHMNNVRYAEIICDIIDHKDKYVSEMRINFISECLIETELNLYIGNDENLFFIRGTDKHKKTKFEASATLSLIRN